MERTPVCVCELVCKSMLQWCHRHVSSRVYVPAELLSEGPFIYRQGRLERSHSLNPPVEIKQDQSNVSHAQLHLGEGIFFLCTPTIPDNINTYTQRHTHNAERISSRLVPALHSHVVLQSVSLEQKWKACLISCEFYLIWQQMIAWPPVKFLTSCHT